MVGGQHGVKSSLSVSQSTAEDLGQYTCKASNPIGTAVKTVSLISEWPVKRERNGEINNGKEKGGGKGVGRQSLWLGRDRFICIKKLLNVAFVKTSLTGKKRLIHSMTISYPYFTSVSWLIQRVMNLVNTLIGSYCENTDIDIQIDYNVYDMLSMYFGQSDGLPHAKIPNQFSKMSSSQVTTTDCEAVPAWSVVWSGKEWT